MLYTRKEMVNLLMLFEEEYAEDNKNDAQEQLNGKTPEQWVKDSFELYNSMTDEELLQQHMTVLDGLYEEGNTEEMATESRKRLEIEKDRLWIK